MTGRGPQGNPVPKLPGPDPTLVTRPVPRERHFRFHSFGPGSYPDVAQKVCSVDELDQRVGDFDPEGQTRKFLKNVISQGNCNDRDEAFDFVPDLTWGWWVFVTAYSDVAQQNLQQAVLKLVETVRRYFVFCDGDPASVLYGEEVFKRFRLDVVVDKDALEGASDDRVREEHNSHVRALEYDPSWEHNPYRDERYLLNRPTSPRRLDLCIVLDESSIVELAALTFPDDLSRDRHALRNLTVKVIDRTWDYPEEPNCETKHGFGKDAKFFVGVDECPIYDIPFFYYRYEFMEDFFPMILFYEDGIWGI